MKTIQTIIVQLLLALFLIGSLNASDRDVALKQGWNQISVPFDHIKMQLLTANSDIEVIWAYQAGRYKLATRDLTYRLLEKNNDNIGSLEALSYGESLYVLAKNDTTITFVGTENLNPPVRSEHIKSMWKQMSKRDFAVNEWNIISKIVDGAPVIASKIVMKDGRPSLKVYSNDPIEAAKIQADSPEFFEDFEVGEDESFWIRDVTNVSDINKFDFTITQMPTQGGELIKFSIDAASSNKKRNYLALKIVAIKDGNPANKEHILFDDYVRLNHGAQEIKAVVPMLEAGESGSYRVYVIQDLAAQYEKVGIDIFNLVNTDSKKIAAANVTILENADYRNISLSGNASNVTYDLKIKSREYANSVLFYNPFQELNRLAKNQSKAFSEYSYEDIARHTEFQMSLKAFGNSGQKVDLTKVSAYLTVGGVDKEIIVLAKDNTLGKSYNIKSMPISKSEEEHEVDLTLSLMMYSPDDITNTTNETFYNSLLSELEETTGSTEGKDLKYTNKICLDTSCSKWIFKKDFTLNISVADDDSKNIIGTTNITLYSDTFDNNLIDNYESKDTSITLINMLLAEDIYSNETDKKRVGGFNATTDQLLTDLEALQTAIGNGTDAKLIFDPLATFETKLVDEMTAADSVLLTKWDAYLVAGADGHTCDRLNYFNKTVPYVKMSSDPAGGDDIKVITATDDLCIYNVDYEYLKSLNGTAIATLGGAFKDFVLAKNRVSEEDRLADFWNPLFSLSNATIHMPSYFGKKLPVINKSIGGGAAFSSKLALDSELNELRANAYIDIDVELLFGQFKLFDLDYETVLSGSDAEASRFNLNLYSINPLEGKDAFTLKKIFTFNQAIPTVYSVQEKIDMTLAKSFELEFGAGPIEARFEFELGVYSYFLVGLELDMNDQVMIYAVPGSRIYGTIAGGLSFKVIILKLDVEIRADDFTVVRAAVPIVAKLDNFRLDKEGFATTFKLFSNVELKAAEILVELFIKITVEIKIPLVGTITQSLASMDKTLWDNSEGFDILEKLGFKVGHGTASDITECQEGYTGWELFCVNKDLKIKFAFSGLTTAECNLLESSYIKRRDIEGDTTYLYSTNEFRKVRGCVNDKYEFEEISLDDWELTEAQIDDINNIEFWKWDSRALISQQLEDAGELITIPPWEEAVFPEEEPADPVNDAWKELTGIDN